jgi:hypothetical protein
MHRSVAARSIDKRHSISRSSQGVPDRILLCKPVFFKQAGHAPPLFAGGYVASPKHAVGFAFEPTHLNRLAGQYLQAAGRDPNNAFAIPMDHISRLDRNSANFHWAVDVSKAESTVMNGYTLGICRKRYAEQTVHVSHSAVGYYPNASRRKEGLGHAVTKHALMIGSGPHTLDYPNGGFSHVADFLDLAPVFLYVGSSARAARVDFARHRHADART